MAQVVPQLDFMQAVKLAYSRLKDTKGRSRRSEFWWAMLAVGVGGGIVGFILGIIPGIGIWLKSLVNIAVVCVSVPLMMRRLHDAGKSDGLVKAYVILFVLMIVLGIVAYYAAKSLALGLAATTGILSTIVGIGALVVAIILIVFCVQDSEGPNAYGPSPKYPEGKPEIPAQQ
ncbi:MAG: DUF805 domain-containing protein [Bacteroidales bacterium]|nr:DUF805 domain-containing protein [Bacteroidales bacterium]